MHWDRLDRALIIGLMLMIVCGGAARWAQPPHKHRAPVPQEPIMLDFAPAPAVTRGPLARYRGKLVSTWVVQGAGEELYNGMYAEVATYDGRPCYTNGRRWLFFFSMAEHWALDCIPQPPQPDYPYATSSDCLTGSWKALVVCR